MKNALGRGLEALIESEGDSGSGIKEMKLNEIEPNVNQPRKNFDDEKLKNLAESIRLHGVVQPIIVRSEYDTFKIVAGERRWRAARLAGLTTIPVIVRELTDKQLMEMSLIENLQREDLDPIEEAEAFERLLTEHDMTQEDIAVIVGRSRPAIANSLRLLELDKRIKTMLGEGRISSGHARALLPLENGDKEYKIAMEICDKGLNVRETEKIVKKILTAGTHKSKKQSSEEVYYDIASKLQDILKTKVNLLHSNKRGKIIIEFYSGDELDRLVQFFVSRETGPM